MEIERGTYRLCLMNTFLHRMNADITLGDALTIDSKALDETDIIIANPPFGSKVGGARKPRTNLEFPTSNKQLEFLQHIYTSLKAKGRAAVVLPDNVLFDDNIGRKIRTDLMDRCNLHTLLRLPTGIFYSPGVKTNVLFFSKGNLKSNNTKNVWIYDMRTNMPQFGKRTPLTSLHFEDFIKCFGSDPNGKSNRKDLGDQGRFQSFSREFIKDRNDDLNISWLKENNGSDEESLNEPDDLAASLIVDLESAISDLNSILEILNTEDAV